MKSSALHADGHCASLIGKREDAHRKEKGQER